MKSKEWAERFKTEDVEQVKIDFALETRELVDSRTKNSTKEEKGKQVATVGPATDGALREQRQKWNAICSKVNGTLSPADFDKLVVDHLNDVKTAQDKWQAIEAKKKEESKKTPQAENTTGRSLV